MRTLWLLFLIGCASAPPGPPSKYPPQKPGCEVQIFPEEPSYQTDNIGQVSATREENTLDQDCLRTLKDEACKLGGDTVWGVNDKPENVYGKKRFRGRAAHQKTE